MFAKSFSMTSGSGDVPAGGQVVGLGGRDQPVDVPPQLLGLRLGRGDAAALEERGDQVAHQPLAVVGTPAELAAALEVAHQ